MDLSDHLQGILEANDRIALEAYLSDNANISQGELDQCLTSTMPKGSLDMLKILLEKGAKLTRFSYWDAIKREEPATLQLLVDHGWNIDSTEFGTPPVHAALNFETSLRWLLDHGANPNIMSVRKRGSCDPEPCLTPLARAAKYSNPKLLDILLSYGAKIDPVAMFTPIGRRVPGNGIAAMTVLLDHGADINCAVKGKGTPLWYAVTRDKQDTVMFLLGRGADPALPPPGRTMSPMEYAKAKGMTGLYEILEGARKNGAP
ncbi:hypothetical protein N0V83_009613 [Neocucurbitaria cava]|uniref:Ankyrin repeat protein n=1 Tax=Neocucurbitaria cava TaxID=798079 RepID=A0A9W9CIH7_9PLEO|nr:hypothetical protein N0V83_009613 [Neocucurbitaria cava]